jgi:hypothetical protein
MAGKLRKPSESNIKGEINFIQNHVPPFDAGTYRLVLSQALSVAKEPLKKTVEFAVAGERFRFNPNEFGTCFPPADGVGAYDNVLPHIVLTRKTLPWERMVSTKEFKNGDVTPWIGLLVFEEQNAPKLQSVKVGDLFDEEDNEKSTLAKDPHIFSSFSRRPPDYEKVDIKDEKVLGYHENADDPCQVIDIPLETFNQVAPAQKDLHLLAHARKLSIPIPGTEDKGTSDYSVVFGNRLPAVGKRNTVYLVSLEGVGDYLPEADSKAVEATKSQEARNKTTIRLVVLHSWAFKVEPSKEENHQSFAQLIANLNGGDRSRSLLRWSRQTGSPEVDKAFELGFTALPHQTRLNDKTVSWYRGPFVPHPAEKTIDLPILGADAITFLNEETGMFDVSYAAAWQIGRLLALNNKGFATQLYNWKRGVRRQTSDKMVQKHLRAMAPHHETEEEKANKRSLVQRIITNSLQNALDGKSFSGTASPHRGDRHAEKMKSIKGPEALQQLHNDKPVVPDSLSKWLGRLMLLHGVPFNYLVSDAEILPVESLRFFRLDMNWMASLIDGANSIGRTGDADAHDQVFAEHLFEQGLESAGLDEHTEVSGFLLRSALVDGWWPGMKVDGYNVAEPHPEDGYRLPILRLERLAPNVLLCLFKGVVQRLDFHPPPEGLHFGLTVLKRSQGVPIEFEKDLRDLKTGKQITVSIEGKDMAKAVAIPFRGKRVLQVAKLAEDLKEKLGNQKFTSAEFAMQMIEGTQMGGFIHEEKVRNNNA